MQFWSVMQRVEYGLHVLFNVINTSKCDRYNVYSIFSN